MTFTHALQDASGAMAVGSGGSGMARGGMLDVCGSNCNEVEVSRHFLYFNSGQRL